MTNEPRADRHIIGVEGFCVVPVLVIRCDGMWCDECADNASPLLTPEQAHAIARAINAPFRAAAAVSDDDA